MKSPFCEHEPAVLAALESGPLAGELLHHVQGCTACAEAVVVATLGARRRHQLTLQITPEALSATRDWLQAEA